MIKRFLENYLLRDARHYPVLTLTGPRQSGKTTLARTTFASHRYVSLEQVDHRRFAREDPRGVLAHALHEHGFLIDHINDQMVNNGIDIPERGAIRTHDCKESGRKSPRTHGLLDQPDHSIHRGLIAHSSPSGSYLKVLAIILRIE